MSSSEQKLYTSKTILWEAKLKGFLKLGYRVYVNHLGLTGSSKKRKMIWFY